MPNKKICHYPDSQKQEMCCFPFGCFRAYGQADKCNKNQISNKNFESLFQEPLPKTNLSHGTHIEILGGGVSFQATKASFILALGNKKSLVIENVPLSGAWMLRITISVPNNNNANHVLVTFEVDTNGVEPYFATSFPMIMDKLGVGKATLGVGKATLGGMWRTIDVHAKNQNNTVASLNSLGVLIFNRSNDCKERSIVHNHSQNTIITVDSENITSIMVPAPLPGPVRGNMFAKYYFSGKFDKTTSAEFQFSIGPDKSPVLGPFLLELQDNGNCDPLAPQTWGMWAELATTCDGKAVELSIVVWTDSCTSSQTVETACFPLVCGADIRLYDVLMKNLNSESLLTVTSGAVMVYETINQNCAPKKIECDNLLKLYSPFAPIVNNDVICITGKHCNDFKKVLHFDPLKCVSVLPDERKIREYFVDLNGEIINTRLNCGSIKIVFGNKELLFNDIPVYPTNFLNKLICKSLKIRIIVTFTPFENEIRANVFLVVRSEKENSLHKIEWNSWETIDRSGEIIIDPVDVFKFKVFMAYNVSPDQRDHNKCTCNECQQHPPCNHNCGCQDCKQPHDFCVCKCEENKCNKNRCHESKCDERKPHGNCGDCGDCAKFGCNRCNKNHGKNNGKHHSKCNCNRCKGDNKKPCGMAVIKQEVLTINS